MKQQKQQGTLKRSMNLLTLTFYGLGTIIGAGIYVLIGEVAGVAGRGMPFSFLLAGMIALLTALSYAELASRYPQCAGAAIYVDRAWGRPWLSGLTGWLLVITGIVSAAAISNGFAGYLNVFIEVPPTVSVPVLIFLLAIIAVMGISYSAGAIMLTTLLELAGLTYVIWAAATADVAVLQAPFLQAPLIEEEMPFSLNGLVLGGFLAFYAFIGFEDMVNVVEEVKNPLRNIPLAILLAISLASFFYILIAVAALWVSSPAQLAASEAPLADLIARTGGNPALISLISLVAVVNGALVQIIMASRVLYGMAKTGLAPLWMQEINLYTRTPVLATLLIAATILVFALMLPLASLARLTSLIMLLIFIMVNLALLRVRKAQPLVPGIFRVPAWVPVLGALSSFFLVGYQLLSLFPVWSG